MRVAIHADAATHLIPGGVGVYVRRLVDRLLAGEDTAAYTLIISRTATPPAAWAGAPMIRPALPVGRLYAAWNFTSRPKIRHRTEVVHATGLAIPPLEGALVATIHDLAVERMPEVVPAVWRRVYARGLKLALDRASVLCAVSQATKTELVENHRIDPERVMVTPLAANVTPHSPCDEGVFGRLDLKGPYILCVGTVEPRKNQHRLVGAFVEAGAALKGWTLVIAGAPGWGQELVQGEIEARRAGHRVIVTGKVTNAELVSLYLGAGIFALPSVYEGFGLPLIEALGFGIPSLVGDTPALTELAGPAAVIADPLQTASIAQALVSLAGDEVLRKTLSEAGRRRAAQFTWEQTAQATKQAYRKAAGA